LKSIYEERLQNSLKMVIALRVKKAPEVPGLSSIDLDQRPAGADHPLLYRDHSGWTAT
jgi:hypothetical protein